MVVALENEIQVLENNKVGKLGLDFWKFIGAALASSWGEWSPMKMEITAVSETNFRLRGQCPYSSCRYHASFAPVTTAYVYKSGLACDDQMVTVLRCEACHKYILGIIQQEIEPGFGCNWKYIIHYPVEAPAQWKPIGGVPDRVLEDFNEAEKCFAARANRAAILMCRRALEVCCNDLGATEKFLFDKIKQLSAAGKLDADLEEMAEVVRKGGKAAAHLDVGDADKIERVDAEAMLQFTKEFLTRKYVDPEKRKHFMAKFSQKPDKGAS